MNSVLSIKNFAFDKFEVIRTSKGCNVSLSYKDYEYYVNIEEFTNLIDNIILKLEQNKIEMYKKIREDLIDYLYQFPREYFENKRWIFDRLIINIIEKPFYDDNSDEIYGDYVVDIKTSLSGIEYYKMFVIKEKNADINIFDLFIYEIQNITKNIILNLKYKGLQTFESGDIEYNHTGFTYYLHYNEFCKVTGNVKKLNEDCLQYDILNNCNKILTLINVWKGE